MSRIFLRREAIETFIIACDQKADTCFQERVWFPDIPQSLSRQDRMGRKHATEPCALKFCLSKVAQICEFVLPWIHEPHAFLLIGVL